MTQQRAENHSAPDPESLSACAVLERAVLRAWAGEPLPDFESAEFAEFDRSLRQVIGEARLVDMHRLGCVTARALLQYWKGGLAGQRAALLAQMSAKDGDR